MNIKKLAKVLLVGMGLGVAASAYAASCAQCVTAMERCEFTGGQNCANNFQACIASIPQPNRCWFP